VCVLHVNIYEYLLTDDDEIPGEKLIRELEREVSRTKLTLSTSRKKGNPLNVTETVLIHLKLKS